MPPLRTALGAEARRGSAAPAEAVPGVEPVPGRREESLEAFAALWSQPGAVVLIGPAGTGKTYLGRVLTDGLAALGVPTERVSATRATATIPFGAFAAYVDASAVGVQPSPVVLLRAVAAQIVRRHHDGGERPVLFVDDAHLLDEGSAAVVHHLAHGGQARLLLTARSGDAGPDAISQLWRDGLAKPIDLAPFTTGQLGEVLASLLGAPVDGYTVGRLQRLTAGNALACTEVITAARRDGTLSFGDGVWRWTGPLRSSVGVERVLTDRLAGCTAAEREALALVALAEPLETDVLAALVDQRLVEDLCARGLLTPSESGGIVALPHPLYGELLVRTAPPVTLRRLRRSLAARLLGPEQLLRRVTLSVAAGVVPEPGELVTASEQALARFDGGLATTLAELLPVTTPARTQLRARSLSLQGRYEELERLLAEATAADPDNVVLVATRVHNFVRGLRRADLAVAYLAEVVDRRDGDPQWSLLRVHHASLSRRHAEAAAVCADDPTLSRVEIAGPLGWAVHQLASAYYQLGCLDECLALLTRHDQPGAPGEVRLALRFGSIGARLGLGRPDEAERTARDLLAKGVRADRPEAVFLGNAALGGVHAYRGTYAAAAEALRHALALGDAAAPGATWHWMLCQLAVAEAAIGRVRLGQSYLDQAARFRAESSALYLDEDERMAQAFVLAVGGEVSRAAQILTGLVELHASHGAAWPSLESAVLLGRIGHGRAARDAAAAAPTLASPLAQAHREYIRGLAGEADALLEAARRYEVLGAFALAAEAADAATRTSHPGRRLAAHRRDRLVSARSLVALPWWSGGSSAVLSAREREVAALAAAGRSNAEIARSLTLSVRTVENHLRSVYAKFGITRRGDLAEAMGLAAE